MQHHDVELTQSQSKSSLDISSLFGMQAPESTCAGWYLLNEASYNPRSINAVKSAISDSDRCNALNSSAI